MTITVCLKPFDEFVECVLSSACVENDNRSVRECLQDRATLERCAAQRAKYFMCRKAAIDPKSRIHGSGFEKTEFQKELEEKKE